MNADNDIVMGISMPILVPILTIVPIGYLFSTMFPQSFVSSVLNNCRILQSVHVYFEHNAQKVI